MLIHLMVDSRIFPGLSTERFAILDFYIDDYISRSGNESVEYRKPDLSVEVDLELDPSMTQI